MKQNKTYYQVRNKDGSIFHWSDGYRRIFETKFMASNALRTDKITNFDNLLIVSVTLGTVNERIILK